jgi:formylglycine-generating enzyme required for sulfatase activity
MKIVLQLFLVTLVILSQLGCNRRETSTASANIVLQTNAVSLVPLTNMVLIKAGTYMRIKFPVTISRDFWLGKYEVTQAEFQGVMGKNPSHFPGDPNRPVEKVTHIDAMAYCAALTKREREGGRLPVGWDYRLPTEGEWEYACRAGSTNQFSFGDESTNPDKFAWTQENSDATTHPVGLKEPNAWGLYDIHGNVWEWCLDFFEPYPATHLTDPTGPAQGKYKVFRGGGWNNDVTMARASNRFMMEPDKGIHFVGFRVALCQTRQ